MSVTVRDCLELSVFAGARVVAGASGLDRIVNAVTVIESADFDNMLNDLMRGNELVITALVSAADDIEKQCRTISALSKGNEAALVLFYVGIIIKELHPEVLRVADEKGFPLIVMPPFRDDICYADTISAVMELVISDKESGSPLVGETISELFKLNLKSFPSVLQMLADKFDCCLIITDAYNDPILIAPPHIREKNCDYASIRSTIQNYTTNSFAPYKKSKAEFFGSYITIHSTPFNMDRSVKLNLIAFDFQNSITQWTFSHISETIGICAGIWKYNPRKQFESEVVHALLSRNQIQLNFLLSKLGINQNHMRGFVILSGTDGSSDRMHNAITKLKQDLSKNSIHCFFAEIDENYILIPYSMSENASIVQDITGSINALTALEENKSLTVYATMNSRNIPDIDTLYREFCEAIPMLKSIFPYKKVFNKHHVSLAHVCQKILTGNQEDYKKYLDLLTPLTTQNSEELAETLAVFLLDANQNTSETSKILFLHANTIQYRIRKIKELLNVELFDVSELFELSIALALRRLNVNKSFR